MIEKLFLNGKIKEKKREGRGERWRLVARRNGEKKIKYE